MEGTETQETFEVSDEIKNQFGSKFKLEDVAEEDGGEEGEGEEGGEGTETTTTTGEDGGGEGEDGEAELKVVQSLLKDYGLDADEEFVKDLDLEDESVESIKKFYEKRDNILKESVLNELFEADADLADLAKWKAEGKSVDSWKAKREAESFNIDIKDDDIEEHEKFVRQVYESKGIKGKKLEAIIEALKDDDELISESKNFQSEIKEDLKTKAAMKAATEAKQKQLEEAETKKILDAVDATIKKGTLDDRVTIPTNERKGFHEFLLNGEREKKYEQLSLEKKMFMDWLLYKDFNVKGMEKSKAPVSSNDRKVIMKKGAGSGSGDVPEMSLNELVGKLRSNRK